MKNIKLILLAAVFAISGLHLNAATLACPAGQKRNKQGKCVKAERVVKANEKSNVVHSKPMKATNIANNAINAYNKALTSKKPDTTKIQKSQQAAIQAVNNLINIYNQYLEIITLGQNPVSYISQVFADNNATPNLAAVTLPYYNNEMSVIDDSTYVSSCQDGSTALCDDGTEVNTLQCYDGTSPDINGVCIDGSLVICPESGNSPMCADGTYAW